MRFTNLGSGSRGNSTLVSCDQHHILVDCGFSAREIVRRLRTRGVSPEQIDGIFITHEHGDHIKGALQFAKQFKTPIYLSRGTWDNWRDNLQARKLGIQIVWIQPRDVCHVGQMTISAVPVPHDAREPLQFTVQSKGYKLGILSDLGSTPPWVVEAFNGCDALLMESNHDVEMLKNGPYPIKLQDRVAGARGHLSNDQTFEFLKALDTSRLRFLVLTHLSEKNNTPKLALAKVNKLRLLVEHKVMVACQERGTHWFQLQQIEQLSLFV